MFKLNSKDGPKTAENKLKEYDILLIQCPPWDNCMPPLGVAFLSSRLEKSEYRYLLMDLNIELFHSISRKFKYLWEQASYNSWADEELFSKMFPKIKDMVAEKIKEYLEGKKIAVIGLSVNFAGIKFANEVIQIAKSIDENIKIVVGGWSCITHHMRSLFTKGLVDVFVIGEGEETLIEVLEVLKGKRASWTVQGAIFAKESQAMYVPRQSIKDLDSLPWSTFDRFKLKLYSHKTIPIFSSRGCIGSCSFCNDWQVSKPYRHRSAANIFEEMKYHYEYNNINTFAFKDLLCNGDINELNLLCDLIIESGLYFSWNSQAISRKEMGYELLCKMKKSGCDMLIYGVESFSNNVLKSMRKIFTKEIAMQVIRDTFKAGIRTVVNIIVGFPGETEEDFLETYNAIKDNSQYIHEIGALSVCLINNDSDLEFNCQKYNIKLPDEAHLRPRYWYSLDGENTYEIRKKRAERILQLIKSLDLPYGTTTL